MNCLLSSHLSEFVSLYGMSAGRHGFRLVSEPEESVADTDISRNDDGMMEKQGS